MSDGIKKSKHGGARPGAGRKKKIEISPKAKSKLTIRQQRAVLEKLGGKTDQAALLAAGYAPTTARAAAATVFQHPDVRSEFQRLLTKVVPPEKVILRIAEGLDAKQTKFFQHEGKVTDSRDVVDYGERRAYSELYAKMERLIPQDDAPQAFPDIQVNIIHVGSPQ